MPTTQTSFKSTAAEIEDLAAASERAAKAEGKVAAHRIELSLRDVSQLFNSMDPSPFHEKDLDHDAEEFIISWAQEFHRRDPVELVVYLQELPTDKAPKRLVEQAVHHYFAYRARLNRMEFKRLMKQGRISLLVGTPFLTFCLLLSDVLSRSVHGALLTIAVQSLMIAGWVAMSRPLEIYLYEWWPLRRRGQIFEKLSRMNVEVRKRSVLE
jgi:hypothetical protein